MAKESSIEKKIIEDFLREGARLSTSLQPLELGALIRLLRHRLSLTQSQLAKRAGISQSSLQRIESCQMDPSSQTRKKIFAVMECDFLVVPIPRRHPDEILKEQARKIAKKRVRYLEGTMALEKQKPKEQWLEEMFEQEMKEILKNPSRIWDEE